MMNKIATRDLFYAQVLRSYGNSKVAKLKRLTKKTVNPPLRLVNAQLDFLMRQRMLHFQQEIMLSKMVV